MKRLIIIGLVFAGIGGAAFGLHTWDTQYPFFRYCGSMKLHYLLHKEAFDRLSEAFSKDPLIDSVRHYLPGTLQPVEVEPRSITDPGEQGDTEKRIIEIDAQQARYGPLLADLKFPGTKAFHKNEDDPRQSDSFGPGADFGVVSMQSRLIHADGVDTFKVPCPSKPLDQPSGDCAEHLGGK